MDTTECLTGVRDVAPAVPPVVPTALVAPNVLLVEGALAVGPGNERLVAGVLAFGVAWYTEERARDGRGRDGRPVAGLWA